jgi:hypothetical protein
MSRPCAGNASNVTVCKTAARASVLACTDVQIGPADSASRASAAALAQTPQVLRNMKNTFHDFSPFRTWHGVNPETSRRSLTQAHEKSNSLPNNWAWGALCQG